MTQDGRVLALKWAAGIVVGFGLLCTLAVFTPLAVVMEQFLRLAMLSGDAPVLLGSVDGRLTLAILGGITAGWGAMIWMLITRIYADQPDVAGPMIVVSTLVWFVVDSLGSVLSGAPFNAVLNLTFLALLVLPVIWPAKAVAEAG